MSAIWRIGETVPRREDPALLLGEGGFFTARPVDDALWMAVIRSTEAHARITRLDLAACLEVPGVALVLGPGDLPSNGPMPAIDLTESSLPAFLPVLADGIVRYVGQPVAVVIAGSMAVAREAARFARIDYAPLPVVGTTAAALAAKAPSLWPGIGNAVHTLEHAVGDPDRCFAAAALVLEERFGFHRVAAMPLEPRGAEASVDAETGVLTLVATTQIPGVVRENLARLLALDIERVTCERLPLGGGFGCKEAVYPEEVLVAAAARRLGRRIRWQESRAEHVTGSFQAREGEATLRMALDTDGMVTALTVDGVSDIGAGYGFAGNSPGAAMGAMVRGPYRVPNFAGRTRSVTTNKTPLNVYRGAGHPQAVFAMERLMDRAAAALGLDRAEIRRRNLIAADAFPVDRGVAYPGAGRIVYDSGDYERCLNETLAAIGYAGFAARKRAHEAANPAERLGIGLAMVVELTSTGPDETVEIAATVDGRFIIETAGVELGQRAGSALAQVLSDRLGISAALVEVRLGSSKIRRSGGGTYASRGAAVAGAAVADGAERLKRAAVERAAERFAVPPDSLRWEDGGVAGLRGRNAPIELADLLEGGATLAVTGEFIVPASSFASACHAAVVAIDIETGVTTVLDYAVTHDCGQVLNPRGVDDQIMGGVMQGIGAVLFETLAYDDLGHPGVRGLMDYTLPVAANVPRFHLRHIETPSPLNPLGFKGAGEGGFTGVPAALVGAIEDALRDFGVSLTDDGPYTPSRVLGLINAAPSAFATLSSNP